MPTTIRPPAVAGQFYPRNPGDLTAEFQALFEPAGGAKKKPYDVVGMVVPHAGHSFSGETAAVAYGRVEDTHFDTIVILFTNHRPLIVGVSIYYSHAYETSLGPMAVDDAFANALEDARILPILMENRDPQVCEKIAQVADCRAVLVIASSGLYHGVDGDACVASYRTTLNLVRSFDARRLGRAIQNGSAQTCGSGTIIAAIAAVHSLGATEASVVSRCNSHQVNGRSEGYVVGYGTVLFSRPTAPPALTPEEALQHRILSRTAVLATAAGYGLPLLDDFPADAYLRDSAKLLLFSTTSVKAP